VPPGFGPTIPQPPLVVLNPVMVKLAGGVSIIRTDPPVPRDPVLPTTMV
jgi:hypothetical protein